MLPLGVVGHRRTEKTNKPTLLHVCCFKSHYCRPGRNVRNSETFGLEAASARLSVRALSEYISMCRAIIRHAFHCQSCFHELLREILATHKPMPPHASVVSNYIPSSAQWKQSAAEATKKGTSKYSLKVFFWQIQCPSGTSFYFFTQRRDVWKRWHKMSVNEGTVLEKWNRSGGKMDGGAETGTKCQMSQRHSGKNGARRFTVTPWTWYQAAPAAWLWGSCLLWMSGANAD